MDGTPVARLEVRQMPEKQDEKHAKGGAGSIGDWIASFPKRTGEVIASVVVVLATRPR